MAPTGSLPFSQISWQQKKVLLQQMGWMERPTTIYAE